MHEVSVHFSESMLIILDESTFDRVKIYVMGSLPSVCTKWIQRNVRKTSLFFL